MENEKLSNIEENEWDSIDAYMVSQMARKMVDVAEELKYNKKDFVIGELLDAIVKSNELILEKIEKLEKYLEETER